MWPLDPSPAPPPKKKNNNNFTVDLVRKRNEEAKKLVSRETFTFLPENIAKLFKKKDCVSTR